MLSTDEYEILKARGTWIDRLKYVLALPDKTQIETYLKQSASTSYDDLEMLLFLSMSTKNKDNLLNVFKTDSFPVRQRANAGKAWLKLQKDETQVHQFVVENINNKSIPRWIKNQILKSLHNQCRSKKFSSSFYYRLAYALTDSFDHDQFNIDAHTLPYCSSSEQISDLLSRWSISRFEQIDCSSPLRSKLISEQPLIVIRLIQADLALKYDDESKLRMYFTNNRTQLEKLVQREPRAMCRFAIEHLNRLDKHKRFLPSFVQSKQKQLFNKAPDEMIELITLAASIKPGSIKYETGRGSSGSELGRFNIPRSFSVDHYVRLFFALYETSKWSLNHTIQILNLMLPSNTTSGFQSSLFDIRKRRKWFFEIVVQQRIGTDEFLKKLLKQGNENSLQFLADYPELSAPLARHLLAQLDRSSVVKAEQKLSFLRYEPMTSAVFDQFLSLFKQTGSDVNQRKLNYPLLLQCAVATSHDEVAKVLQWIEKRFANEQLMVIEHFLQHLKTYDNRFQLQIIPKNVATIEAIMNLALNHLQQTSTTLQIVSGHAIMLLTRVEHHGNKGEREKVQEFACKMISRCFSINNTFSSSNTTLPLSCPVARNLLTDILITKVFPQMISKGFVQEMTQLMSSSFEDPWRLSQIDTFLVALFFDQLPSSDKLRSSFKINQHPQLLDLLLKPCSTRYERTQRLITQVDQAFLVNDQIQRIAVSSPKLRSLIDQLIRDERAITIEQLAGEQSKLIRNLEASTKNEKIPGLKVNVLNSCINQLTGEQQEHITKIILDDYLKDKEVSNVNKLKALRVLRRMTHTYNLTLEWIEKRLESSSESSLTSTSESGSSGRGTNAEAIDDIIMCLPTTFDLNPNDLVKQLNRLTERLNAANAKYVSDALLVISRKLMDEVFMKPYLDFIRTEKFQKLGVTANKEVLRLLVQYRYEPTLITTVIQPFWSAKPHQDVRAVLITTLLHFLDKSGNDDASQIWSILEEAPHDDYLPVVYALFANWEGKSSLPNSLRRTFVERIQFRVFDHPNKLEARSYAWSNLDRDYCDDNKLLEKAKQVCVQFDKNANQCWEAAFGMIISGCKQQKYSLNVIIDLVQLIMSRREELDGVQNALDNQHDLPVYHRVHRLLSLLVSRMADLGTGNEASVRQLVSSALQFQATLAPLVGQLLLKLATSKEYLEAILVELQKHLSNVYFEQVMNALASNISQSNRSCPFVEQLSVDEKLELAQWFIREKNRESFVFDLLIKQVFGQASVDRKQCQILLRQLRQSNNFSVQQQACEFTVPWKETETVENNSDEEMSVSSD